MAEWHVTPDYIVTHWTEELLELMISKLTERKTREVEAVKGPKSVNPVSNDQIVSDKALFNELGVKLKVNKA
ncbi:MAG: hypothetical protein PHU08_00270 [Dehalococcoidales bacterium]|nr:hypothetical protein [Dehalococcoidales bacterium]